MTDRTKELETLAAEAKAAWKRTGAPVDLLQYFRLQAQADKLKQG